MTPGLRIEPLARRHRPLCKAFRNQHPSLVEYLARHAIRHIERDLLARTYVAIDHGLAEPLIAGTFSLSTASVERIAVAPIATLQQLPRFPIPSVLLARLAVDSRVQGQGLGRYLFEEALGLTVGLARSGPVAFRLLVTDAFDAQAARFYERFGLERISDAFPCRMVLDLRQLVAAPDLR